MRKLFLKLVFALVIVLFVHPGLLSAKSITDDFQLPQEKDLGIGPVKKVELGPLNNKMVGEGKTIYTNQCIICHDLDQNKLGPALKNVTKTRTPEYIMNILLNPAQMQSQNATVKALLKQYNNLPMPDPALNQAKARSVLEYLRSLAK
jgi:cytochrome c551/c552